MQIILNLSVSPAAEYPVRTMSRFRGRYRYGHPSCEPFDLVYLCQASSADGRSFPAIIGKPLWYCQQFPRRPSRAPPFRPITYDHVHDNGRELNGRHYCVEDNTLPPWFCLFTANNMTNAEQSVFGNLKINIAWKNYELTCDHVDFSDVFGRVAFHKIIQKSSGKGSWILSEPVLRGCTVIFLERR